MARAVDYTAAEKLLVATYGLAEQDFRDSVTVGVPAQAAEAATILFKSRTQAYREALVGCALVHLLDPAIDIRHPYTNQGDDAFSGRTLDERVINPFFQDRAVPVSRSPYLSSIRRGVAFVPGGASGQRDMEAFNALVSAIEYLRGADAQAGADYLRFLLGGFVRLREDSNIPLRKIGRLSLEQHGMLIDGLLATASGGLIPVVLAVALLNALSENFSLNWQIFAQGINVADAASGAGGDITVTNEGKLLFAIEVTERPIERKRVVATFDGKISPNGLEDYIFFYTTQPPAAEALEQARRYFAQGHEIHFVKLRDWLVTTLATIGPHGRGLFVNHCIARLGEKGVPNIVKQAWNDRISAVAGGTA